MSNLERMRNNGFRMHFWTSVDKRIKDRTWRPALTHCDLATHEICESVSAALEDHVMDHITPVLDNAVYTAIERVVHGEDV